MAPPESRLGGGPKVAPEGGVLLAKVLEAAGAVHAEEDLTATKC